MFSLLMLLLFPLVFVFFSAVLLLFHMMLVLKKGRSNERGRGRVHVAVSDVVVVTSGLGDSGVCGVNVVLVIFVVFLLIFSVLLLVLVEFWLLSFLLEPMSVFLPHAIVALRSFGP